MLGWYCKGSKVITESLAAYFSAAIHDQTGRHVLSISCHLRLPWIIVPRDMARHSHPGNAVFQLRESDNLWSINNVWKLYDGWQHYPLQCQMYYTADHKSPNCHIKSNCFPFPLPENEAYEGNCKLWRAECHFLKWSISESKGLAAIFPYDCRGDRGRGCVCTGDTRLGKNRGHNPL